MIIDTLLFYLYEFNILYWAGQHFCCLLHEWDPSIPGPWVSSVPSVAGVGPEYPGSMRIICSVCCGSGTRVSRVHEYHLFLLLQEWDPSIPGSWISSVLFVAGVGPKYPWTGRLWAEPAGGGEVGGATGRSANPPHHAHCGGRLQGPGLQVSPGQPIDK